MDIAGERMVNQRLWGTPFAGLTEALTALGPVQAQEFAYAKWSLGQRSGAPESLVDKAFADGDILRTHVLRPTWHFVARDDIRWLLELTGPRVQAVTAPYYRQHGLTDFDRPTALWVDALKGGKHLQRKEMRAVLEENGIVGLNHLQITFLLLHAELDAVICSGALQGKQQTYALLDERAPNAKSLSRDEALVELVRRYFTTRGPATLKDFAWWSGLTQADGRHGLEELGWVPTVVNGRTYFGGGEPVSTPTPRVDLVQIYDEIGVAYSESRDVVAGEDKQRGPVYRHSILLNGKAIGHWRRTSVSVDWEPHRALTKTESKALAQALDRYQRWQDVPR